MECLLIISGLAVVVAVYSKQTHFQAHFSVKLDNSQTVDNNIIAV